ncbi:MAG: pyridoxal-phosphate dependent enzyme [Coriobacteriia bacterium]|nr:pyridoxal-phosphate dependent enzyme [Coriobacteriia bacterium]
MDRPLFARIPGTRSCAWEAVATLPTPVREAPALAAAAGAGGLWVKRDDLAGGSYGGNKVRKLEFLLGEARAAGASDLVTFGAAGSNHALATAIYGSAAGVRVHSMLLPQYNARYVRRNLLASLAAGADLHHYPDRGHMMRGTVRLLRRLEADGRVPFVIPFGGTTPTSTMGFVNAGFELAAQVEAGVLPEPDLVFCALGSMGTAAGLAIGMRLAGMRSRLVAVPILSYTLSNADALLRAIVAAQEALESVDGDVPRLAWTEADFDVLPGFLGEDYALFTPEGMEAIRLAREYAGISLDGTYTGKALAGLLARGRAGALAGKRVLFWNTYNSRDIDVSETAARALSVPARLRHYFEDDVQELDRDV